MFKAIRTVYFENDKKKVTEKKYETYKQAKAYAKRYSKLVNGARFVEVEIFLDTDSFKFKNVDIFVADSNGFENEHLEEIEKFQRDNETEEVKAEKEVKYLVKGMNGFQFETSDLQEAKKVLYNNCFRFENVNVEYAVIELAKDESWKKVLIEGTSSKDYDRIADFVFCYTNQEKKPEPVVEPKEQKKDEKRYNFYVEDYTEKREVPIMYGDYMKKEIIKEVQGWVDKNNHTYKIFIADETSDKALAGRVFFKTINWKPIYGVGKTGSRVRFGEFSYEEAEKYCKEYAEKDDIAYTIYEIKLDKFGRDEFVPVADIEPPEKVAYYGVRGYSRTFDTIDEAVTFAKNQRSKSELIIYKAIEIDNGIRTSFKQVDVVPAYGVEQHYELEINEYNEAGYMEKENGAKFKTLEEATSCVDELIKNVGENSIVLRLYKVIGEDFECLFTKHASKIHGLVAIAEDKPGQTVAETPAEYITDSELISMLVKEPVNASLYDFMREPQKVKVSKKGRKRLNAVREIVKRALIALPEEKTEIKTPDDIVNLMMKRLRYKNKEYFYAIVLDTKNKVVNISKISEGSLNASIVHPTDVFKEVLRYETACSVVFVHNHPSGDPTPSTEDINVTFRLVKAGKVLDIEVLDHIIIGDGIYKSFKQAGLFNGNATSLPWLDEGR